MIATWQWPDNIIYSVVIYGGQYITLISYFSPFDCVLDAIVEKGIEMGGGGGPIHFISGGHMAEEHADRMAEDEMVSLIVRR